MGCRTVGRAFNVYDRERRSTWQLGSISISVFNDRQQSRFLCADYPTRPRHAAQIRISHELGGRKDDSDRATPQLYSLEIALPLPISHRIVPCPVIPRSHLFILEMRF